MSAERWTWNGPIHWKKLPHRSTLPEWLADKISFTGAGEDGRQHYAVINSNCHEIFLHPNESVEFSDGEIRKLVEP